MNNTKDPHTPILGGIKGIIFDYGGTLDTCGQHWGKKLWHAYERQHVPVTEQQFRERILHITLHGPAERPRAHGLV